MASLFLILFRAFSFPFWYLYSFSSALTSPSDYIHPFINMLETPGSSACQYVIQLSTPPPAWRHSSRLSTRRAQRFPLWWSSRCCHDIDCILRLTPPAFCSQGEQLLVSLWGPRSSLLTTRSAAWASEPLLHNLRSSTCFTPRYQKKSFFLSAVHHLDWETS